MPVRSTQRAPGSPAGARRPRSPRLERNEDVAAPLSYCSTGSTRALDAERIEEDVRARGRRSTCGIGCCIVPRTIRPDSSRSSVTGTLPARRLQLDHAELERRAEHERRAERGMPGEPHLDLRVEDPDPDGAAALGRQDEDGLGEADLEREPLHRLGVQPARIGEDRELVARQRCVGEDVGRRRSGTRSHGHVNGVRRAPGLARHAPTSGGVSRAQRTSTSPVVIPRNAWRVVGWMTAR